MMIKSQSKSQVYCPKKKIPNPQVYLTFSQSETIFSSRHFHLYHSFQNPFSIALKHASLLKPELSIHSLPPPNTTHIPHSNLFSLLDPQALFLLIPFYKSSLIKPEYTNSLKSLFYLCARKIATLSNFPKQCCGGNDLQLSPKLQNFPHKKPCVTQASVC